MNTGQITASTITVGSSILAASGMMSTEVIPPNAENVSESPFAGILQDCSAARQPALPAALARLISSTTKQPLTLPRGMQTVQPPATTHTVNVPSKIIVDRDHINLTAHDQQQPEEIPVSGTTDIPADTLMSQNVTLLASLIGSTQQSDIPAAGKNSDQQTNNRPEVAQTLPIIAEAVVGKRTNAELPVTHYPKLQTAVQPATTTQPIEQRQTLGTETQSLATGQAMAVPVAMPEIQRAQQAIIRDNPETMIAKHIPAAIPDQGVHHEVTATVPTATPPVQEIQTAPAATTSSNTTGLPVSDTKPALAAPPQKQTTADLAEQSAIPAATTAANILPSSSAPVTQPLATATRKLEAYFQTTPRAITATQQPLAVATATATEPTTVTALPIPTATVTDIHPPQTAVRNNPETMTTEQLSVVTPERIVRNEAAATVPTVTTATAAEPALAAAPQNQTTAVVPEQPAVSTRAEQRVASPVATRAPNMPPQLQQSAAPVAARQFSTSEGVTPPATETVVVRPLEASIQPREERQPVVTAPQSVSMEQAATTAKPAITPPVAVAEVQAPQPAVLNNPETMTARHIPATTLDQVVRNEAAATVPTASPSIQEIQTAPAATTASSMTGPLPTAATAISAAPTVGTTPQNLTVSARQEHSVVPAQVEEVTAPVTTAANLAAAPVTQPAASAARKLEAYFQTTARTITATQQPLVATTATETESTTVTAHPVPSATVAEIHPPQTAVRDNPETMTAEQISVVTPERIVRNEAAATVPTVTTATAAEPALAAAPQNQTTAVVPEQPAVSTRAEQRVASPVATRAPNMPPQLQQSAAPVAARQFSTSEGVTPPATETVVVRPLEASIQPREERQPVVTAPQSVSMEQAATTAKPAITPPVAVAEVQAPQPAVLNNPETMTARHIPATTLDQGEPHEVAATVPTATAATPTVGTTPQNLTVSARQEHSVVPAQVEEVTAPVTTAANRAAAPVTQPATSAARKLEAYFQTTARKVTTAQQPVTVTATVTESTATAAHPAEPVITPGLQQATTSATDQQLSFKEAGARPAELSSTAAKPAITTAAVPVPPAAATDIKATTLQTDDTLRSLTHVDNTLRHVNTGQMLVAEKRVSESALNRQTTVTQNGLSDVVAEQSGTVTPAALSSSTFSGTGQDDRDSSTDSEQERIWFGQSVPGNKHEAQSSLKPASFDKELQNSGTSSTAEHVMRQVKESLTNRDYRPGVEQITLHLTPENMGEMKLTFRMENQQLKIDVVTDTNIVRDTLLKHTESLKETLAKQNITVESFNVATGSNSSSSGRDQSDWRELAKQRQQTPAWMNNNYQNSDTPLPQTLVYQAKSAYSMVDVHF